jgi:arylsulfatase A-like enzyme
VVPQRYADLYAPADMPLWPNVRDDLAGKPAIHRLFRDKITQAGSLSDDEWRVCIARYYAFCTLIDEQFGRLITLLDELGVTEDTLALFVTDHGDLIGAHRLFDKGPMMYDEQLHIPLIVRWPGMVAANSECDAMTTWLDLMPTLVEASGLSLPKPVDGRSLLPMLQGQQTPGDWPDDVFCQYSGEGIALYSVRGVRSRQYKYVYYPLDTDELYDLDADPWEMQNLIDEPNAASILAEMRERLGRWMQKSDDVLYNWNVDVTPMGSQM